MFVFDADNSLDYFLLKTLKFQVEKSRKLNFLNDFIEILRRCHNHNIGIYKHFSISIKLLILFKTP